MGRNSDRLSRREFALTTTAAIATAGSGTLLRAYSDRDNGGAPLQQFGYAQVQLPPGRLQLQFDENHRLFLSLSEDSLLKPYRQRAGLPAPGADMGGWYDNSPDFNPRGNFHGFVPGHSFGQYVSALARMYAATGDSQILQGLPLARLHI